MTAVENDETYRQKAKHKHTSAWLTPLTTSLNSLITQHVPSNMLKKTLNKKSMEKLKYSQHSQHKKGIKDIFKCFKDRKLLPREYFFFLFFASHQPSSTVYLDTRNKNMMTMISLKEENDFDEIKSPTISF